MKHFILIAALFCSVPAFAEQLLAEAQCSGIVNGQATTITTYVNESKFCSSYKRNIKSSVIVNDGSFGTAFNALGNESRGILKYTSGKGQSKMELKMKLEDFTGTFLYNGKTFPMECSTIEYEMEC